MDGGMVFAKLLKSYLLGKSTGVYNYHKCFHGGLQFPGTGCPVPDVANIYFTYYEMSNVWATVSTIVHLGRFPHGLSIWKTNWPSYDGLPLYHKYILNSG